MQATRRSLRCARMTTLAKQVSTRPAALDRVGFDPGPGEKAHPGPRAMPPSGAYWGQRLGEELLWAG